MSSTRTDRLQSRDAANARLMSAAKGYDVPHKSSHSGLHTQRVSLDNDSERHGTKALETISCVEEGFGTWYKLMVVAGGTSARFRFILLLLVAISIDLHYDFSTAYRSRSLKRTSPAVPAVHQRTFGPFIVHSDLSVTLTVHEPDR